MAGTAPSVYNTEADWAFIQKIAIDASGNLFAATNTGLKYFNGTEWAYAKAADTELLGLGNDVVAKNGSIIAAVDGNVYISSGNANDFVMKSGEEEGMLPLGPFGNIKFDISITNGDYMYASYVKVDGTLHNVYTSTDKGNTWRVVYPGGSSIGDIFSGQGLQNNAIAVSLSDEKTVYLGAYDVYKGYESQPLGYFNWTQITNGFFPAYPGNGIDSKFVHFGINYILLNPAKENHAFVCTDGGMSITRNSFKSNEIIML